MPQHEVIYLRYSADNLEEYNSRIDMKQPIITILDRLKEKIQNDNKIVNLQIGLFRMEIKDYSENVFQEALLNALSHRDYESMASVYVKHYPDKIVIENPGGFIDGVTPENIITHPSSPRNKLIAETLQRLKYVQRTGQGVDIIYRETISMGKPYPEYTVYSDAIRLTIRSFSENLKFVEFIVKEQDEKNKSLQLSELMVLRYLIDNKRIKLATIKKLTQLDTNESKKLINNLIKASLMEVVGKEYMLTSRVYDAMKLDIEYAQDIIVNYIRAKDKILEYLNINGSINIEKVRVLCGYSKDQARRTLEKLKFENLIQLSKKGRYAEYTLVK